MMLALLIYGGFVAVSFLVVAWLLIRYLLERLRVDSYPPEAAEAPPDPVEEAFTDARRIVSGRLPSSSVDELVEQFDWPRYATWLKEPS